MHYYFPVHWGVLPGCQNRSVRSFNSMQGVTNPQCAIRRLNTVLQQGINAISLMHAVISRSYPEPSAPVSWQIIHAIIIHLLKDRNPQTSREFRLCTSTSHPCHLRGCLRFLVVIPKQSRYKCRCSAPGLRYPRGGLSAVRARTGLVRRGWLTAGWLQTLIVWAVASCWKAVLRLVSGHFAGSSGASSELHESSSTGQHTGFECETQLNHECRRLVNVEHTLVGETG